MKKTLHPREAINNQRWTHFLTTAEHRLLAKIDSDAPKEVKPYAYCSSWKCTYGQLRKGNTGWDRALVFKPKATGKRCPDCGKELRFRKKPISKYDVP